MNNYNNTPNNTLFQLWKKTYALICGFETYKIE